MLRSAMLLTLCLLLAGGLLPARGEEEMLPVFGGEAQDALAPESLEAERSQAWDAYSQAQIADETLIRETAAHAMQFGEATMRYFIKVIGEKPENGYPMYIAMHGGGSDDEFIVVSNFANVDRNGYPVELPPGQWKEVFNTDGRCYGGSGNGNGGATFNGGAKTGMNLPSGATIVLKRV